MSAPAITVGPDALYSDIVSTMLSNDVSGMPVVDATGALIGVISEGDLIVKEGYGDETHRTLDLVTDVLRDQRPQWIDKAAGLRARDLMSPDPVTVELDDALSVAARRMLTCDVNRLPVVCQGTVVGVISRSDVLRGFDPMSTGR